MAKNGDFKSILNGEHTQEPWHLSKDGFASKGPWKAPTIYSTDEELRYVAVCACADEFNIRVATNNLANAERIVACVNALEGYSNAEIEFIKNDGGFIVFKHQIIDLTKERDGLRATNVNNEQSELLNKLAQQELIIKELRESVAGVVKSAEEANQRCLGEIGMTLIDIDMIEKAKKIIATEVSEQHLEDYIARVSKEWARMSQTNLFRFFGPKK